MASISMIKQIAAISFNRPYGDVNTAKVGNHEAVRARDCAILIYRNHKGAESAEVREAFGLKSARLARKSWDRAAQRIQTDPDFARRYRNAEASLARLQIEPME